MTTEKDWVKEVGEPAYASIVEMVAAYQCDYDRLEELREARNDYEPDKAVLDMGPDTEPRASTWAEECPDDAEELKELEEAAGECESQDDAYTRIQEDALSVEIRSDWTTPGEPMTPGEFNILLTTGGPAVRIMGELDEHGEPYRAWLEVQDWGKPWTQYFPADPDTLLTYARCFCFAS